MMQPIADSDEAASPAFDFGGERRAGLVRYLGATDHELFSRAVEAAQRGDWVAARSLAEQGGDTVARRLIEWAYLRTRNSGASFAEMAQFLKDYPDWPGREALFSRAEEAIGPTVDPRALIAWFGARTPQTGIGKVRLGEALIAAGSVDRGREWIRQAWIANSFRPDQELYVIAQHGNVLTPDADRERLEHLLAQNDLAAARRQMVRVGTAMQRLAETRILLRSDPARGEYEAAALPSDLRDDPGLLFDQARVLRLHNDIAAIPAILARAPVRDLARLNPTHWWTETNLDARALLQQGYTRSAYLLSADTALPQDGSEYADAEFLAGWIALRELKEPAIALTHFENLVRAASRPVSRARAYYWAGRACEAAGHDEAAWREYHAAAENPAAFYGQLALARIVSDPGLHLPATPVDAEPAREAFEHDDLTRAVRVLADLGLEGPLREFAVQEAKLHRDGARAKLLTAELTRMGFRDVAVRVAKQASYDGIRLFDYSHPVIAIPRYAGPGIAPENALVLAIVRQETEFDPDAVSVAGARGLMQVMPDAAAHLAEVAGLGYRPSALLDDASYNMELGMTELAHQLANWGGSYLLAAAAYNAGPGNVRKWIAAYGDPRDVRVDPVDWIEQIPFQETRNYVQRVLENVEVYRNRLAGRDEPLQILDDLYRPDAPQVSTLRVNSSGSRVEAPGSKTRADNSAITFARTAISPPDPPAAAAPAVAPEFKPSPGSEIQ